MFDDYHWSYVDHLTGSLRYAWNGKEGTLRGPISSRVTKSSPLSRVHTCSWPVYAASWVLPSYRAFHTFNRSVSAPWFGKCSTSHRIYHWRELTIQFELIKSYRRGMYEILFFFSKSHCPGRQCSSASCSSSIWTHFEVNFLPVSQRVPFSGIIFILYQSTVSRFSLDTGIGAILECLYQS